MVGQAKFAVEDLLAKLQGDRIGLLRLPGLFVQCPLTIDYEAFRLAEDADPHVIPRGRDQHRSGDRTALKGFQAGEGHDQVIVLVTDGEETEEQRVEAAADEAANWACAFSRLAWGTQGELIRSFGRAYVRLREGCRRRGGQVAPGRAEQEAETVGAEDAGDLCAQRGR